MRKTIDELKKELSKNPKNDSFRLLSLQEQDACKGQGNYIFKKIHLKSKYALRRVSTPSWVMKYKLN